MPKGIYKRTEEHNKKISNALRGRTLSKETKKRMSESRMGRVFSEESRRKIGISKIGNKNTLGHRWSLETRQKMSEAHKGKVLPIEQKRKISLATKGKTVSKETRSKLSRAIEDRILNGKFCSKNFKSAGYREDIDLFVRSKWEANVVRILKSFDRKFEYESKNSRFKTSLGTLILDLYLPEDNVWIEVKGYLYNKSKNKMKEFVKLYPDVAKNTYVIDSESYKMLAEEFSDKIIGWEK
jgi:hypothetical protein